MIEKRFDIPFVADMALREKQIQQNYRPIIAVHKWFARRPGTLFRALLLSEFIDEDLRIAYYRPHDLAGRRVCDPFMGGGTPLVEANRLGCDIVGSDVNPMAYWIVREEIEDIDLAAYKTAAGKLQRWLTRQIGHLYETRCAGCGRPDAAVKYFLWVKTTACSHCGTAVDLFPGYLIAEARRHPMNVVLCAVCGALCEVADAKDAGACYRCGRMLATTGPARNGICKCSTCGRDCRYPKPSDGPPIHRMVAIEYHCQTCKSTHRGRFFKSPDDDDRARYAEAERRWSDMEAEYVPHDAIPPGDETDRLHRWGYKRYSEMFNERQLLGLEISCRGLIKQGDQRLRNALATNLSDLLRYQNMLCRYDTGALKSLDVFSVHGFPVGLLQCESNLLGITASGSGASVGSGGWANITAKYARAKAYCEHPFETVYCGARKRIVQITGEWIGASRGHGGAAVGRQIDLQCRTATELSLTPGSLDAVVTDPPYFANVQYAELMDFCYVWLRRLVGESNGAFALPSTRHPDELTGNATRARGLPEFTEGLATAMKRVASSLKPGAPLAFTYHHNLLEAYMPVVVALLDARLVATASLPCPAEMGASIHINGTGSSIVDTVFVCRASGVVWRRTLPSDSAGVASLVMDDVTHLKAAGLSPTAGDIRCIAHGHIARIVLWRLRPDWQAEAPTDHKLARVTEGAASLGGLSGVTRHLKPLLARTSQHQAWSVREGSASYGEDDEIRF